MGNRQEVDRPLISGAEPAAARTASGVLGAPSLAGRFPTEIAGNVRFENENSAEKLSAALTQALDSPRVKRRFQKLVELGVTVVIGIGDAAGWAHTGIGPSGRTLFITMDVEQIRDSNQGAVMPSQRTKWAWYHPLGEMLSHEIGHALGLARQLSNGPILGIAEQTKASDETNQEAFGSGSDFREDVMNSLGTIHLEAMNHPGGGFGSPPTMDNIKLMREQMKGGR